MNWLQSIDFAFFHWINTDLSNPVFDVVLPLCRDKFFWAPFYVFIAAFMLENFGARSGGVILIGLVLAVGLSDFTSSELIKKNVQRVRPCNDIRYSNQVIARAPCGSGYSFTSSHAANHFAVAVYLCTLIGFKKRWATPVLLLWAGVVSVSQVYVGVHYPLDVLSGGVLGATISFGVGITIRQFGGIPSSRNKKSG